ncbi:hypothetical protein ACOMHN_042162 [Nucella lapillus]
MLGPVSGVARIGPKSLYPAWYSKWCDDVMMCGRAPLNLRLITVTATAGRIFQIIEQEMEAARLSEELSDQQIMHTLRQKEEVKSDAEHPWDAHFAKALVDFDEFTNIVLWCGSKCIHNSLNEILRNSGDHLSKDIVIFHMTRILIVDTSIQSYHSSLDANNQSDGQSHISSPIGQESEVRQRIDGILEVVQDFYHVAVLWKRRDCVRLQTLTTTKSGSRQFSYAGFGDNLGHMVMTSEVFPNVKWRLNGQKLSVGTAAWEPFVVVEHNSDGTAQYSGLCIDILRALSLSLNFTYELRVPEDGQFGSAVDGNWTGLIKMLKDREVQLVVAPLAVDELRAAVVDFSTPFYLDYTGVLFRRPDPAPHKWKTYFRPFRLEVVLIVIVVFVVLLSIGASFLVATTFGHVVGVVSANVMGSGQPDTTLMDTVQYFFGSLLAQGGIWNPTTGSARLFLSAWWMFCVVMAAIYSGNLTASLAVSWYTPSFTTLQQMIDAGTYSFGTVPGTIWFDIFKSSNRSDFQAINQEMYRLTQKYSPEKIDEIEEHVALTHGGNYAYIGNVGSLRLTVQDNCDLMVLPNTFLPMYYSIALVKGSPLTAAVSRWILHMSEGGLGDFWASQWWKMDNFTCDVSKKTDAKTLTLEDCQTAFFILLAGLGVALLAVFLEVVLHFFRHWKHGKPSSTENEDQEINTDVSRLRSNVTVLRTTNVPNGIVLSLTRSDLGGSVLVDRAAPYVNGFYRTCNGEVDSILFEDLDVRL